MLKKIFLSLAFIISINALPVFAQDYIELTFSDTFSDNNYSYSGIPALSKEKRVNSNAPSIIISGESDLEEQVSKSLDYAMSVWKSCIIGDTEIFIEIRFEDIEEDIKTTVRYQRKDDLMFPVALYAYLENMTGRDQNTPDGIITINSNTDWDYNIGDNISSDKKNLSFGIMRAVARILGFGSSIQVESQGNYSFADKRLHSVFDSMVSDSSNKKLTSIGVNRGKPSQELKEYVESPGKTFWLNTGKVIYQLAEPPYTKDNPPFVFIKDMNSLMKGDLSTGDYILNVDEATRAILRDLGWDAPATALISIAGDDVDDTGLASAYSSHKFRINKGNLSISDPKWVLELPLANGKTQSMQLPDNNLSCTTAPIGNEKNYKINSDGDIEAQLKFTCTIDGAEAKASFKIYFELKPLIEYAVIERIEDNAPYDSYNAYYKVKYRGAEKIQIYVEEEYAPKVKYSVINEPYIAHGMADHITAPFFAWINFVAENEYGKSIYTIELEPYGAVSDNSGLRDDSLVTGFHSINIDRSDDCRFEVYDAWGRKLGVFTDMSEIKSIPQKGILIIRHINGQSVKTLKFVNK